MTLPEGRFVAAGGLRIHYHRAGAGPTLVLLHGWPEFAGTWRHTLPALAERFDVIAPDLRGFGRTRATGDAPPAPDPPRLAADLAALLDALGIARAGLVSHDVGSAAAQAFARAHPDRVSGLLFFNCLYPGIGRRLGAAGHLKETWYQYFNRLPLAEALVGRDRESCRLFIGHFLTHWAHDPHAFDAVLEEWVDNFMQPGVLAGGFEWYRATAALRLQVINEEDPPPPIPAPTRVLWGASDPVMPAAWADRIPEFFPNATADIVEAAGHFVHFEQPARANAEIRTFFEGLADGP